MMRFALFIGLVSMIAQYGFVHGGRLNSEGCHNQSGGEYHCHKFFESTKDSEFLDTIKDGQFSESIKKYNRDDYGGWIDADGDCMNTRAEVLSSTSLVDVVLNKSCTVITGQWFDQFSNKTYTKASDLDIDHIVPLKWAHDRGAYAWPASKKVEFANDPLNLKPVLDRLNQAKGAKPPSEWMPPNHRYRCQYLDEWQAILSKYDLAMIASEQRVFNKQLAACSPI